MELYHRTLIPPDIHSLALALHLNPIKPKEEHQKPRQLLLATSNSILIYHLLPGTTSAKHQLKQVHEESLFSNICALDAIVYQDDDLRKDILIVTLGNGKYQLLEWLPNKEHFAVIDQNVIFSEASEVESGLAKPSIGHYIAVNNEAKLVMIASANFQCKIYSRVIGYQGIRLSNLAYFKRSLLASSPSICLHLQAGQGNSSLFFSLRRELKEGQKVTKVYKVRREQQFEEEGSTIDDNSAHLIVPRGAEGSYFVVADKYLYYSLKGKMNQIKIPQIHACQQVSWWRRPLKERKEEYFLINEHGQITVVNFDESNPIPCSMSFIEVVAPCLKITPIEKNLFFLLSVGHQHLLIEAVAKYKVEERLEKTRSSAKLKQQKEKEQPNRFQQKEFEVVGTIPTGRLIRDMKICNIQRGMNNQILLAGGRPNCNRGFLSVIKYGLKLKSHLSVSCTAPNGIWAIKRHISEKYHTHIVLGFSNRKTLTFHYDSNKLIPSNELRLDENEMTLLVCRFGDNSLVQVVPSKIKFINKDGSSRDIFIKGRIMKATSVNEGRQLLISLVGGFLEYYQVVGADLKKIKEIVLEAEANQIEFSPPELVEHRLASRLIVASLSNYHNQVYAITNKGLELITIRNFKMAIESLAFVPHLDNLYAVHLGGHNGRSFRWLFNKNGEHVGYDEQILGERTIRYSKITVDGKLALFRLSPQPNVSYIWQGQIQTCGLPLPAIDHIEDIKLEGISGTLFITYYDSYLRFIQMNGFGNLLYSSEKQLGEPGRKIVLLDQRVGVLTEGVNSAEDKHIWISRFIFLNPNKEYQIEKNLTFDPNEKVLSVAALTSKEGRNLICFGTCMEHSNFPTTSNRFPSIKIYSYQKSESEIIVSHLFSFPVDGPPTAMDAYFSKLLVGVDRKLMLFDIYKQKLVLRASSDTLSSPICSISVYGQKIFLTQIMSSFSVLRINHKTKCFETVGQDFLDRFTTCGCLLDGEAGVMAGGDKFGNFFVSKMSEKMRAELEEVKEVSFEPTAATPLYMDSLASFHLGEIVTAIQTGRIDLKKSERIYYATIDGRVGMLYPMDGEEQTELMILRRLEEQLGKSSLAGASNNKNFRSYFNPAKGMVDGDFCEQFRSLLQGEKGRISGCLGREPKEILRLLEYMQNKFS